MLNIRNICWFALVLFFTTITPISMAHEISPTIISANISEDYSELKLEGQPLTNAQVQVWDKREIGQGVEEFQSFYKTDEKGRFTFTPKLGGVFMMSSVHMVPTENPKFVWESFWANLSFAR